VKKSFCTRLGIIVVLVRSLSKLVLELCLFYWPSRTEQKCKEDYEVLVYTSDGLQAHILPNLVETKSFPQRSGNTKTMH
jgi:hypothetical protein